MMIARGMEVELDKFILSVANRDQRVVGGCCCGPVNHHTTSVKVSDSVFNRFVVKCLGFVGAIDKPAECVLVNVDG